MSNEKVLEAIKKARESGKRKFKQTFDLAINLKGMDMKKPENKVKTEISLPHTFSKGKKIGVIADALIPKVKGHENVILIRKDELESLGKNKKAVKALARQCKGFIAEAPLMPLVGKNLGQILAVRNQMPTPIPPTVADIKPFIEKRASLIRIALKDSPVIHCAVGIEDMDDSKIAENIETVINGVISSLPKDKENIKNFYLKLTMGKGVKFVL